MRTLAMVFSAMLVVGATAGVAQAQAVCAKEYGACMDRCATMGNSPTQGRCFMACQTANDDCGAKLYGSWRAPMHGSVVTQDRDTDALAQEREPVTTAPRR